MYQTNAQSNTAICYLSRYVLYETVAEAEKEGGKKKGDEKVEKFSPSVQHGDLILYLYCRKSTKKVGSTRSMKCLI